ncbi:MAG: hypothetical protein NTZ18_05030, partial [Candidatus Komeilibacteria bacterium]|nr:hypothetical protein [Candidatus Komeilibacteria bacterium]
QASKISNQTYAYDQNGNLTSDGVKSYAYNWADRLTHVQIDQNNVLLNSYDQAGQRTVKQLTSITPNPLGGQFTYITKTTYPNSLYEEATSGNQGQEQNWTVTKTRHITLGNQTIAHFTASPQGQVEQALVFGDHLGSASLLTDAFGRPKVLYDYYPFGSSRMEQNIGGGLHVAAYQYTGKEKDAETGLYNYGARYYEAATGRFTQSDPVSLALSNPAQLKKLSGRELDQVLANPQNLNSYAYAVNNPIIYVDPDGHFWREAWSAWQGVSNAFVSNNAFGLGRVDSNDAYFNAGQTVGDVASMAQGALEAALGVTAQGGGAVVSSSGVGALVGAPAIALGLAVAGHGIGVAGTGAYNLSESLKGGKVSSYVAKPGDEISGLKVTKHGAQQINERGLNPSQIDNALNKGQRYYDATNKTDLWVVGKQGGNGYVVVTDVNKTRIVTVENFVPNLSTQNGTRFIKY